MKTVLHAAVTLLKQRRWVMAKLVALLCLMACCHFPLTIFPTSLLLAECVKVFENFRQMHFGESDSFSTGVERLGRTLIKIPHFWAISLNSSFGHDKFACAWRAWRNVFNSCFQYSSFTYHSPTYVRPCPRVMRLIANSKEVEVLRLPVVRNEISVLLF